MAVSNSLFFERTMNLCIRHCTGVKPCIDKVRSRFIGFPSFDTRMSSTRTVQVDLTRNFHLYKARYESFVFIRVRFHESGSYWLFYSLYKFFNNSIHCSSLLSSVRGSSESPITGTTQIQSFRFSSHLPKRPVPVDSGFQLIVLFSSIIRSLGGRTNKTSYPTDSKVPVCLYASNADGMYMLLVVPDNCVIMQILVHVRFVLIVRFGSYAFFTKRPAYSFIICMPIRNTLFYKCFIQFVKV